MVIVAEKPLEEVLERCHKMFANLSQPGTLVAVDKDQAFKRDVIKGVKLLIDHLLAHEKLRPEYAKELRQIKNAAILGLVTLQQHDVAALKEFLRANALALELHEKLLQPTR